MNNADKPAFTIIDNDDRVIALGLTKREYFACHAPFTGKEAGLILDSKGIAYATAEEIAEELASMNVQYADALIAALERKPE